jgi:hypothetical protein
MPTLHRYQWIDAQIRAGRYPNARLLAAAFEISHRQALRDFEYMRDSLGAPLVYSAPHRGFTYEGDRFTLPGAYVTASERTVLAGMASYYAQEAERSSLAAPVYEQMAGLLRRIGGSLGMGEVRRRAEREGPVGLRPYKALLRQVGPGGPAHPDGGERPADAGRVSAAPPALLPFWRGELAGGLCACEFTDPDSFLAAVLAAGPVYRIESPGWLRERLQRRLQSWGEANLGMTCIVTPPALSLVQEPVSQAGHQPRRDSTMRVETKARMHGTWLSYIGAVHGAVQAAGLCDLDLVDAYGISGMGAHFVVHETCCPSSVTVYNWMLDHVGALDRMGILSEVYLSFPGSRTYEAACRRAITNIKASIDRGVPVVLWGVDVPEFGVVYGYDDADGVLLVSGVFGQGPEASRPILYENVGRTAEVAPILHYQVPVERVEVDLAKARQDALAHYVARMERPEQTCEKYHVGLAAYDAWLEALTRPDLNHRGLRYLVYVYYETKDFMAAYVRRLAESGQGDLAEAAERLTVVSAQFEQMMQVLGQSYEPPPILEEPVTAAQLKALDSLLREARAKETAVVGLLKKALAKAK